MNHMTRLAATPLALALCALPGAARPWQANPVYPQQAQGMFSNFSVGMTVGGVPTSDSLVIRAPGLNNGIPTPWTAGTFTPAAANHPNFSITALTTWAPNPNPTSVPPIPEVSFGGMSTGGEVMPTVNLNGELIMPVNWFMLSVAVAPGAAGVATSVLNGQIGMPAIPRNPAGDIFSYYAIGSQNIDAAFVNHSFLESSREQLRLDDMTSPAAVHTILNLDWGMGVISTDPTNKLGRMFDIRDCFFFTLTKAYVDALFLAGQSFQIGGSTINPSTVYGLHWNGTTWDPPQIIFTSAQLFGTPGQNDPPLEIDALSVDRRKNQPWNQPSRLILSLTLGSNPSSNPYDQLLVYQRGWTQHVKTLRTDPSFSGGVSMSFSDQIGLRTATTPGGGPDEATATCGGDPYDQLVEDAVVAVATDEPRTGRGTLGCSAMRRCPHDPNASTNGDEEVPVHEDDTLQIQVTGLEHTGWQYVLVELFDEGPVGTLAPHTALGPPYLVDAASLAVNGYHIAIPVPCNLTPMKFRFSATLHGLKFTPAPVSTVLGESWVLTVKL